MFARIVLTLFLIAWSNLAVAQSNIIGGGVFGDAKKATTYQGPGDVVSSATAWGSCARAYSSAVTAGTNMCDLVDSAAPTVVICTLQTGSNGFVNLTQTNCTGSVTPATKCAAATGGVCNISKVYDQAGSTGGFLQATAANQPILTFSAINSLPGIKCSNTAPSSLVTVGSVTLTQPFSLSAVGEITTAAQGTWLGASSNSLFLGRGSGASWQTIDPSGATTTGVSAADNAFHAAQGVYPVSSGTLTISVDGTAATTTAGSGGVSTSLRFCRQNAQFSPTGIMMEGGYWPVGFSGTQITNMNANEHGANGYNF